jgi:hypothetical protein
MANIFAFLGKPKDAPDGNPSFIQNLKLIDLTANFCIDDFELCKQIYVEMDIDKLITKMPRTKFIRHIVSNPLDKKPYIAIVAYLMNAKKIDPRAFSKLDVESVVLDLAARLEKIRNDIAMSEKGKGGFIRWYCCENDGLFITVAPGDKDKRTMYFELIFTFGDKATNMLFDAYASAQTKCIGDT